MKNFLKKVDKFNSYCTTNWVLPFAIFMGLVLIALWVIGVLPGEDENLTTDNSYYIEITSEVITTVDMTTEPVIEPTDPFIEYAYRVEVSDEDIALMARVVMSEASTQSYDCKVAVAETIINRLQSNRFPDTVYEIVYQIDQYSTQDNGAVTDECYTAVVEALTNQRHPSDMYYLKAGNWHGWAKKYMKIDNTYFSTEKEDK